MKTRVDTFVYILSLVGKKILRHEYSFEDATLLEFIYLLIVLTSVLGDSGRS